MRKTVSILLALLMICAMLPVTAFAASEDPHGVTLVYNAPEGKKIRCTGLTSYWAGIDTKLPVPAVEDFSYAFLGWYDNSDLNGSPVTVIPAHSDGHKTFYAKWGKVYKTTWHKNGGTLVYEGAIIANQSDPHNSDYTAGKGAKMYEIEKTGCDFIGWYDNPSFTGNPVTVIDENETGDKEYWARFCDHANTAEINLPKNGDAGTEMISYYYCKDCDRFFADQMKTQPIGDKAALQERYWGDTVFRGKIDVGASGTTAMAFSVTANDTAWGVSGKTSVYIVDDDITLNERPVVKGAVHIILADGKTLTANRGITLESNNSISFYARSDDGDTMGRLSAFTTGGITAIGGNNGGDGGSNNKGSGGNGGNGTDCGDVYVYGGLITLKTSGVPCIGGGNGGKGGGGTEGGKGGSGGKGGNAYFYGGKTSLESSGAVCIGGGNGGKGGDAVKPDSPGINDFQPKKGRGGNGGDSGKVYFHGGNTVLKNSNTRCIGGGSGGGSGTGSDQGGGNGQPGSSTDCWNVTGDPAIKAGTTEQSAGTVTAYVNEWFLSVRYDGVSSVGSILSDGDRWLIVAAAVVVLGVAAAAVIVGKKKKKPATGEE